MNQTPEEAADAQNMPAEAEFLIDATMRLLANRPLAIVAFVTLNTLAFIAESTSNEGRKFIIQQLFQLAKTIGEMPTSDTSADSANQPQTH